MTDVEILESTYFDLCTIKRKEKIKNPTTGITETVDVVKYENVKCAVSKMDSQASILEVDGIGNLVFTNKLFISPNIEILEGDTIQVSSMGKMYIYLASKSFPYPSHSEILITYKGRV